MNIAKGQKATVFQPEIEETKNGKGYVVANISTYEGKDSNGNYIYSNWRARFVGKAVDKAESLADKDRIVLNSAKIESNYNKEQNRAYVTVIVFDFDIDHEDR